MLDLLSGFVQELRTAGIPVSLTENLDAMNAIKCIPMEDREAFKYALATTLVKSESHWQSFETVFDVYFSIRGPQYVMDGVDDLDELAQMLQEQMRGDGDAGSGMDGMDAEQLAEMLMRALANNNGELMRQLAAEAVRRFSGMEPGRPVGGTYYLYRTLRNLDLDRLLRQLMDEAELDAKADGGELLGLDKRLKKEEFESRIEDLKKEIESEIRRRLVEDRGVEAMAKTLRKPLPEDVDFMHASREEMVKIRKSIQPLTRKLAARMARRRRHKRKGGLDFRQTMRTSLSYGGVPADPRFKKPRPSKPEIIVLADISGSVASFARFTLHLVYAISNQFSNVRAFVFIDGIDEVTRFFESEEDIAKAIHRINTEADVVWVDGHSDYGHAFEVFWDKFGTSINSKTTVLCLGDARNNYHAANAWVLKNIREKARSLFWLNPEPRSYWNTGDSIIGDYATHCDEVFECRNLRQLENFVDHLV